MVSDTHLAAIDTFAINQGGESFLKPIAHFVRGKEPTEKDSVTGRVQVLNYGQGMKKKRCLVFSGN